MERSKKRVYTTATNGRRDRGLIQPDPCTEKIGRLAMGNPVTVKQPDTVPVRYKNSLGMEFVLVRKGTFWMGGTGGVPGRKRVEIPEDFDMGVTEVTQAQWQALMGFNPSFYSRQGGGKLAVKNIPDADLEKFPVGSVSWLERMTRHVDHERNHRRRRNTDQI